MEEVPHSKCLVTYSFIAKLCVSVLKNDIVRFTQMSTTNNIALVTLIDQAINFGSVWLALTKNAFTVRQLLDRLLELEPGVNVEIAYRHACMFGSDEDQIGLDGTHFLASRTEPSFSAIFVLSGRKVIHEETKSRLVSGLTDLAIDPRFAHRVRLMCDDLNCQAISNNEIGLVIRCHSRRLFRLLTNSDEHRPVNIVEAIAADWMEQIPSLHQVSDPKVLALLLSRAKHLAENAPLYWEKVGRSVYTPLFRQLRDNGLFREWCQPDFIEVLEYVPGIIDVGINPTEMSPLAFRVWAQPSVISAYLLGFPIHQMVPSRRLLDTALTRLSQLGPEAYMRELNTFQRNNLAIERVGHNINMAYPQEEDLMSECVFDYGAFDRVTVVIEERVFHFTRPEFASLLESRQNPWSNKALPDCILETIRSRVNLAKTFKLPDPAIVNDLLSNFDKRAVTMDGRRVGRQETPNVVRPTPQYPTTPNRQPNAQDIGRFIAGFAPPSSGRMQGPVAPRAQARPGPNPGINLIAAMVQQALPGLFGESNDEDYVELNVGPFALD